MVPMARMRFEVEFTTPAFLGGADQQAAWRSAPFKALLRQWWRIGYGARSTDAHTSMRRDEGRQFGNAWIDGEHRRSDVRLRLESPPRAVILGSDNWPTDFGRVLTSERNTSRADLYLGYGPVEPSKGCQAAGWAKGRQAAVQVKRGALAPGVKADLTLLFPRDIKPVVTDTVQLMAWFGTLGSRSRNGWGSLSLTGVDESWVSAELEPTHPLLQRIARPWRECLKLDWPHALGLSDDGRPLVWLSNPLANWRRAVTVLAKIKAAVRARAKARHGQGAGAVHYLGYPAGGEWKLQHGRGPEPRLAGQLRFKVNPVEGAKVRVTVFHLPARLPDAFLEQVSDSRAQRWLDNRQHQEDAWAAVHDTLNKRQCLRPLGGS